MSEAYEGWAIVEIMGHQSYAGLVKSETQYGVEMLRIDVPEIPAETRTETRNRSAYGWRPGEVEVEYPGIPAYTKYFGGTAIYGITSCDEEVARAAVKSMRKAPVSAVYMPELNADPKVLTPLIAAAEDCEASNESEEEW